MHVYVYVYMHVYVNIYGMCVSMSVWLLVGNYVCMCGRQIQNATWMWYGLSVDACALFGISPNNTPHHPLSPPLTSLTTDRYDLEYSHLTTS